MSERRLSDQFRIDWGIFMSASFAHRDRGGDYSLQRVNIRAISIAWGSFPWTHGISLLLIAASQLSS
jgi:hypothetical protein